MEKSRGVGGGSAASAAEFGYWPHLGRNAARVAVLRSAWAHWGRAAQGLRAQEAEHSVARLESAVVALSGDVQTRAFAGKWGRHDCLGEHDRRKR